MLLRFQNQAVRGNYETGKQAFSIRLRFLTRRGLMQRIGLSFRCLAAHLPSAAGLHIVLPSVRNRAHRPLTDLLVLLVLSVMSAGVANADSMTVGVLSYDVNGKTS